MKLKMNIHILFLIIIFLSLLNIFNIKKVKADDITGLKDFKIEMDFDKNNNPGLKVSGIDNKNDKTKTWQSILDKYKGIINFVIGFATMTIVLLFIINFVKLAKSGANSAERTRALTALLWVFIGGAALGGITLILSFFRNLLQ